MVVVVVVFGVGCLWLFCRGHYLYKTYLSTPENNIKRDILNAHSYSISHA